MEVGVVDGREVGVVLGELVPGFDVGFDVGPAVGLFDGTFVGKLLGDWDGLAVGVAEMCIQKVVKVSFREKLSYMLELTWVYLMVMCSEQPSDSKLELQLVSLV